VTGADGQLAETNVMSSSPATFRHEAVTFQVPTTLPPQSGALEHSPGWLVPALPPFPFEPPLGLPPLPAPVPLELPPQPLVAFAEASTIGLTSRIRPVISGSQPSKEIIPIFLSIDNRYQRR